MCLPIIGGIISGIGAVIGAIGQARALEAQARANERQAEIERDIGAYEGARHGEKVQRIAGQQRANYAASGVIGAEGSALSVLDETAVEGAMDIAAIRYNANSKADILDYNAKINRMNAKTAKASAPFAFLSPVLSGAARMTGSFSKE